MSEFSEFIPPPIWRMYNCFHVYSFPPYEVGRSWYHLPYPDGESESLRVFSDFFCSARGVPSLLKSRR